MNTALAGDLGCRLNEMLGLNFTRREGHDFAGPCISCDSSDAFRMHMQTGVCHCFSCGGSWSPFRLAETFLCDREQAKAIMVELGIFEARGDQERPAADPLEVIARQKGISPAALLTYGASRTSSTVISLPAYGPDGKVCTTFSMDTRGGKGLYAKDRPAGLFLPHVGGQVQLPSPEQTWLVVEGPKDAGALWDLGFKACGLNNCRMNAKFARLFRGVHVNLVPDRDRPGEEGAAVSAGVLRSTAASIVLTVLPAEWRETKGDDVRDVLKRPGGRELVLQAIDDARSPEWWDAAPELIEIPLQGASLCIEASEADRDQRLIVATYGAVEHRDVINLDSSVARDRFVSRLARKLAIPESELHAVEAALVKLARKSDRPAEIECPPEWGRLLEIAPGLRGRRPDRQRQREALLAFAGCLADPHTRKVVNALIVDLLSDEFEYILGRLNGVEDEPQDASGH